jgi:hypothetical protein
MGLISQDSRLTFSEAFYAAPIKSNLLIQQFCYEAILPKIQVSLAIQISSHLMKNLRQKVK